MSICNWLKYGLMLCGMPKLDHRLFHAYSIYADSILCSTNSMNKLIIGGFGWR